MIKTLLPVAALLAGLLQTVSAQSNPYTDWQHSGSLYLLTTPEGANLPASASEDDFPVLVRLNRDDFDFSQAKAGGEDVRFATSTGTPLAYQIDDWDAARGTASVWVRIPHLQGNARQEIKMFWGKADAASESDGKAVFNESNGYLSVWHMNDPVTDAVGTVASKDTGTAAAAGVIGPCRHFADGKGITGGDQITNYPTGSSPSTSEAWFRAEKPNAPILAWGNEQGQGKVVLSLESPAHIRVDCYFSGASVSSGSTLALDQWFQVVHTCQPGDSRIFVNGVLDGNSTERGSPLNIRSPAHLFIGGWYDNYPFTGDIDEVRISKVARSADWVKLEYENQKPLQTLVGPLVPPGSGFSVSAEQLTVLEGRSATVTARAGGAQKIYWIVKDDGRETIVAVDRLSFSFDAGRVTGNKSLTLQFKAVYPQEVKTQDIPITIQEDIPDPVFTLKAPARWDGRQTIAVEAQIANLAAMQAKGAGHLNYTWKVSGLATIQRELPGKLELLRAQNSGELTVTATVDNGGQPTTRSIRIAVREPQHDAWVHRTPGKDEQPVDNQFYARDDRNEGTLFYNGTLNEPGDEVFLKLFADGKLLKTESQKPGADKHYAFTVKLKPGLIKYQVEFGTRNGAVETVLHTVTNLVCGDAYMIQGQSNALATDTGEKSPPDTSDWIRSYGRPEGNAKDTQQNLWCNPVWKAEHGEKAELGYWGMELAKRLVASEQIPIFILNGAVGGTRIDQHQRNDADPTDLKTIYGRALWRLEQAHLTDGLRGILWHQGENNQGAASPGGDYDWKSYEDYFVKLSAAWKGDFPNVQHYYVFQIWPNACSMGGSSGCGDRIRDIQRRLPRLYSNLSVMSTLGIKPEGGCHYPLAGWAEFARLIQPLIERDNYGKGFTNSITPPDVKQVYYTSDQRDEMALEFDQPVVWNDALTSQFYPDGEADRIASGSVSGNVLTLKLKSPATAKTITYLQERHWDPNNLLYGQNGIAALTFCDVPILPARPAR